MNGPLGDSKQREALRLLSRLTHGCIEPIPMLSGPQWGEDSYLKTKTPLNLRPCMSSIRLQPRYVNPALSSPNTGKCMKDGGALLWQGKLVVLLSSPRSGVMISSDRSPPWSSRESHQKAPSKWVPPLLSSAAHTERSICWIYPHSIFQRIPFCPDSCFSFDLGRNPSRERRIKSLKATK